MGRDKERMTKQKKVILEELMKVNSHPTAYDIYERVKPRLPKISLGTVYRNLEHLSARGVIRKLEFGQGQRRFDAAIDDHSHIRCVSCGRIEDIPVNHAICMAIVTDEIASSCGYEVIGCEVNFQGICPSCQEKRREDTEHDE